MKKVHTLPLESRIRISEAKEQAVRWFNLHIPRHRSYFRNLSLFGVFVHKPPSVIGLLTLFEDLAIAFFRAEAKEYLGAFDSRPRRIEFLRTEVLPSVIDDVVARWQKETQSYTLPVRLASEEIRKRLEVVLGAQVPEVAEGASEPKISQLGSSHGQPRPRRRRGRPSKLTVQSKRKALEAWALRKLPLDIAKILYKTNDAAEARGKRKNISSVLGSFVEHHPENVLEFVQERPAVLEFVKRKYPTFKKWLKKRNR